MSELAYDDFGVRLFVGDCRAIPLPDASVDVVVTSPPYFGLRAYKDLAPSVWGGRDDCEHEWGNERVHYQRGKVGDHSTLEGGSQRPETNDGPQSVSRGATCARCGAWCGTLGNEPTVASYMAHLVEVMREVRRVLKPTGSALVNLGDSYAPNWSSVRETGGGGFKDNGRGRLKHVEGQQAGSLLLVPARFAIAMAEDGWLVRQDNVWAKASPMPESIDGWRWERCRVKVADRPKPTNGTYGAEFGYGLSRQAGYRDEGGLTASYEDCQGCATCEPNGGFVLRRGSWRTTRAHEVVFHLTLGMGYYGDRLGAAEPSTSDHGSGNGFKRDARLTWQDSDGSPRGNEEPWLVSPTRNPRSVWQVNSEPSSYAHYAAYPVALVERALRGLAPERVCSACGAPWARIVEKQVSFHSGSGKAGNTPNGKYAGSEQAISGEYDIRMGPRIESTSLGWRPTCSCNAPHEPGLVLDPFAGTGTTLVAARKMGLRAVGVEASQTYADMAAHRLAHPEVSGKRPVRQPKDAPTLFDFSTVDEGDDDA